MAVRLAPPPSPPSPPPLFRVPSPPPPAAPKPPAAAAHSLTSTCVCLGVYFTFNLTLTLYNKLIFSAFAFPFPWTLTAIHTLCGTLGCHLCAATGLFTPARLGRREKHVMVAFSVLYTVNIAISNVSLNLVTVPFHQVVRSTVPLFTVLLSTLFLSKHYSRGIYLSLLPIVFGVVFATTADYNYTLLGLLLTLLGTVLAAVKTIVTNIVQVGDLRLHPLDLLLRMSPLACLQTVLWAVATGEAREVAAWVMAMSGYNDVGGSGEDGGGAARMTINGRPTGGNHSGWVTALALLVNGALAFGLNVASFVANRRTSALTMCVAGNVKQVLSIILSVAIFQLHITTTNAGGILITLLGGIWYTYVDYREKNSAAVSTSSSSSCSTQSLLPTTKHMRSSKHAHDDDDDDDDDNDEESELDRDSSTARLLEESLPSGVVGGEMVEVVIRSTRGGAPTA
ncbi:triose-phosphate transporter family-domain-containing protein [Geranomyces variabilis]|nr:triose-phosphate transporter family-domain-containing protein [Geranomyces variabilis]KAJ3133138.1 UAA transporter [Geranomyces variabilis]